MIPSLPFTFDDPVKPRGYDMESAIMRLSNYSQLEHPKHSREEFVHPEHTKQFTFIEPNTEPIHNHSRLGIMRIHRNDPTVPAGVFGK